MKFFAKFDARDLAVEAGFFRNPVHREGISAFAVKIQCVRVKDCGSDRIHACAPSAFSVAC